MAKALALLDIPTEYYGDLLDRDYHFHSKILVVKIAVHGPLRRQRRLLRDFGRYRRRHRLLCLEFLRVYLTR